MLRRHTELGFPPVEALEDGPSVTRVAQALIADRLFWTEIVFPTHAAKGDVRSVASAFPEILLGAGAVPSADQATTAVRAGPQFVVSSGFNPVVVDWWSDRPELNTSQSAATPISGPEHAPPPPGREFGWGEAPRCVMGPPGDMLLVQEVPDLLVCLVMVEMLRQINLRFLDPADQALRVAVLSGRALVSYADTDRSIVQDFGVSCGNILDPLIGVTLQRTYAVSVGLFSCGSTAAVPGPRKQTVRIDLGFGKEGLPPEPLAERKPETSTPAWLARSGCFPEKGRLHGNVATALRSAFRPVPEKEVNTIVYAASVS